MGRISVNITRTIAEEFERFILFKTSEGLAEKTVYTYRNHFKYISKFLDVDVQFSDLKKEDIQNAISEMRKGGISPNSIASYVRVLKAFISWAKSEGMTDITISNYKTEETIKETYTDNELLILLKKPNMSNCRFSEYRTWVIMNFLINSGARASTIRYIKNKDVDFDNGYIAYRHNKGGKVQLIPLCSEMIRILKEYVSYRGGELNDYLFCSEDGIQLSESALRRSIERYNKRRGIAKTSTHLFRHTFAKKYLLDCEGNAFALQKLLGHSTLDMTRHYCNLYDADIIKNYDSISPLQLLTPKNQHIKLKKK